MTAREVIFSTDENKLRKLVSEKSSFMQILKEIGLPGGGFNNDILKERLHEMGVNYDEIQAKNQHNKDLTGQRFGKLTAKKLSNRDRYRRWICECECGRTKEVMQTHLMQGNSQSCGQCSYRESSPHFGGYGEIHKNRFNDMKKGAKNRGHEFNVTIEQIWKLFLKQDRKCKLSGLPLEFGNHAKETGTASLDRIDSNRGYIKGNIQWVHRDINMMKHKLDQDYFLSLCEKITKYNKR